MQPCYVYVDEGYVRPDLRDAGLPDEFDPRELAKYVSGAMLDRHVQWGLRPTRIFYYDALDETRPEEAERQERYFRRLERLPNTHVRTGYVRRGRQGRRQQKAVDVQLAVDALEAAASGKIVAIGLVAGDADFVPLAEAVRRAGPHVVVVAFKTSAAEELLAVADYVVGLEAAHPDWVLPP